MKVRDLKLLFSAEIDKVKENKQPTTRFIVQAYKRVLAEINNSLVDDELISREKICGLDLTAHMKEKLIKLMKRKPRANGKKEKLMMDLESLMGIGAKKARELVANGLTDINQLQQKKWFDQLNADTQLMLSHKPLRKIPREAIAKIEDRLVGFGHKSVKHIQLVGSFRRCKPFSKDIDVLFCAEPGGALDEYIEYLKRKFRSYVYSRGPDKVSLIIQPARGTPELKYKVDIFRSDPDSYHTNLLYSTGSKEFNIKMRARAKKMGYLLNQTGLYKNGVRVNSPSDTEEKLFEYLGMDWREPADRS
jgi:DNA polymerase (family 10)